jgi:hypothetical protein
MPTVPAPESGDMSHDMAEDEGLEGLEENAESSFPQSESKCFFVAFRSAMTLE